MKTILLLASLLACLAFETGCETVSTTKSYSVSSSDPVPSVHSYGSVSQPKKEKSKFLGLF